jgi:putative two-component system protein, hydrogenase maturation factor HypX/HoxX
MHILFAATAHNSLSQRLALELAQEGHTVSVRICSSAEEMIHAAALHRPDLILAPMLKTAIPDAVWRQYPCLIVHPGIKGDRGPSSLDWAILLGVPTWGVTVLQAIGEMDAGPIWASHTFRMPPRPVSKSSLYRGEVTEAAVRAVREAVANFAAGDRAPEPLDYRRPEVSGMLRPAVRQVDRRIDWTGDSTAEIARKVRAADSSPGVLNTLLGHEVYLYGAHEEDRLRGPAGQVLGRRHGALCLGTVDGAIWITHLKTRDSGGHGAGIKLPAAQVLGQQLRDVPRLDLSVADLATYRSFREIRYREQGDVGYLSFDFYNGAMSTGQCRRLRTAFVQARARPTRVICLLGGRDFWSNGIHLNVIEAAPDPAWESWRNITAMDDLILEILSTPRQLVVAALRGNAGAGGVMLALASDWVYARRGVVLNPHYKSMGNLYGSEYWTYTLPRRVGTAKAVELTEACQPIEAGAAQAIGLVDEAFGGDLADFEHRVETRAQALAERADYATLLATKQRRRQADERAKPLARYRADELSRMADNFFGPDTSYHEARWRFVHKTTAARPAIVPADLMAQAQYCGR